MTTKKQNPVTYKREKGKVEISGDPQDIKAAMWFDLISTKLIWLGVIIVLLCMVPKVNLLSILLELVKRWSLSLIFLLATADYSLRLLSG